MSRSVMGLGILFVLMGLWIAIAPDQFVSIVDWESRGGLYSAAVTRILIGLILIFAGPSTRYPKGLRIFGGVILVAGLGLLFVPIDLWASLMHWALGGNVMFIRVGGGLFGMLFGAFLVHAAQPARPAAT